MLRKLRLTLRLFVLLDHAGKHNDHDIGHQQACRNHGIQRVKIRICPVYINHQQTAQQNAYHKDDTYVPLEKQQLMMKAISKLYRNALIAIRAGVPISDITSLGLFEKIIKIKYDIPNDKLEMFDDYFAEIDKAFHSLAI